MVVVVALGISVIVTARVLIARADHRVDVELTHEGQKFRGFVARDRNDDGRPYNSVAVLLGDYLRDNVPDRHETFFSVVDGAAARRSRATPPARLDRDPAVIAKVAAATTPITGETTTAAGPARYAAYPIRVEGDPRRGALVVVEFYGPEHAEAVTIAKVLAGTGIAALAVATGVGWLVAGRVLRPIRTVRQTAQQISAGDLTRRIDVRGHDDVAALAATFNRMLDRLEQAFANQRQFLDDAGHELRTPITVIRGHLDLMGDSAEDRRETLALVTDELDRMSRMVDDLLVLATASAPDFLHPGPVDVTDLVVESAAKARALAQRRWAVDEVADTQVIADEQRLTQAMMQLAANAVAHTGPGDTIAFGASLRTVSAPVGDRPAAGPGIGPRQQLRLWVRDTGTGIDPAEAGSVFERFARGRNEPAGAGAGLGLAIVASIARAHGGRVELDSSPGHGATFTLVLPGPARPAGPESAPAGTGILAGDPSMRQDR